MGLKDAILQIMDRDVLKSVVKDLELIDADRRSVASMRERVVQSHDATPENLLEYLYETQVKDVCALLGIDTVRAEEVRSFKRFSTFLPALPPDSEIQPPKGATQADWRTGRQQRAAARDNPVRRASLGRVEIRQSHDTAIPI